MTDDDINAAFTLICRAAKLAGDQCVLVYVPADRERDIQATATVNSYEDLEAIVDVMKQAGEMARDENARRN